MKADSSLRLRAAHRSEAAAMAALSRLHVEHGLRWRWTPPRVRQQIEDPDTMALVASVEGQFAGFGIMHFGDLRAHLVLLAVEPRFRKSGIGSALLRWLEASCVTAGIQDIRLEVRAGNQLAQKFYRNRDFTITGRIPGYYDRREAAVVMERKLTQAGS
jgi:[ribosomal protein S18]-alanine N-acetyltransferase